MKHPSKDINEIVLDSEYEDMTTKKEPEQGNVVENDWI